jgi:hypothetical protein
MASVTSVRSCVSLTLCCILLSIVVCVCRDKAKTANTENDKKRAASGAAAASPEKADKPAESS